MSEIQADSDSDIGIPDAIGVLADEFMAGHRQGLNPRIEDYCECYPELATRIRDVFSTLLLLEQCGVAATGETVDAASSAAIPTSIGDFQIIREIGRGGMGIVYEAEQHSLGRRVALKVLPSCAFLSPSTIERFRRESRAAAGLHHANIVPVFGVGEDNGLHYYVMPCIRGVGLDQVLVQLGKSQRSELVQLADHSADSEHPPTIDNTPAEDGAIDNLVSDCKRGSTVTDESRGYWYRIARIGLQVADALEYALGQGVLHRDIKPSNLLLDTDGIVWVTDFGLAKLSESDNLTRAEEMLGTLRYLAPERLRGIHDVRGDIYGLGLTLYELLTLEVPFNADNRAELTQQILEAEPPRPRSIDPQIPLDLETIVLKAIAKAPQDRYQSHQSLADDLRLFLGDRPIKSRRTSYLEHAWRWCRRNPAFASLSACVGALIAITIVVLAVSNASIRRETSQKNAALTARSAALSDRETAYQKLQESVLLAQARFYASQTNLAGLAFQRGEIVRAEDLLESVIPTAGELDLRGFEWYYLRSETRRGQLPTTRYPGNEILGLSFSADATRLLIAGGDPYGGTVCLIDVINGKKLFEIVRSIHCANGCAYAPNGSAFAIGYDDGELQIVRADTFEYIRNEATDLLIKSMAWSPDSKLLAVGCECGELMLFKMPELEGVTIPDAHQGPILRVAFSLDSKRLFTSADWGGEGVMGRQWNVGSWPPVAARSYPNQSITDESPDGQHLAATKWGTLQIIDASGGHPMQEKWISSGPIVTAKYTSDGTRLLVGARTDRVVRTLDAKTLDTLKMNAQSHIVSALAVDSSGRYWAAGDSVGDVCVWDTTPAAYDAEYENPNITSAFFVGDTNQVTLGGDCDSMTWSLVDGTTRSIDHRFGLRDVSLDGKAWVCLKQGRAPGVSQVVEVWREGGQEPIAISLTEPIYQNCLAVSASGRWLATRFDMHPVDLYDLSVTPIQPVRTLESRCFDFAFSPDERLLVCGQQYGSVGCFDVASGKQLPNFAEFESFWSWGMSVAFSADSRYVAAGNESGTVRVWEADSRQLISTLAGQPGEVRAIAFFPDGRRLAQGGTGDVQIWDYRSGQELLEIPVKGGHVQTLAINAAGDTLIVVTPSGTARAWVGTSEELPPSQIQGADQSR